MLERARPGPVGQPVLVSRAPLAEPRDPPRLAERAPSRTGEVPPRARVLEDIPGSRASRASWLGSLFGGHGRAVAGVMLGALAIPAAAATLSATPSAAPIDTERLSHLSTSPALARDVLFSASTSEPPAASAPAASPAIPALPSGAYDVSDVSDTAIAALRRSSDPAVRRLGSTIVNARRAYADHIENGARLVVTRSNGNGGQPVLTIVAPGFDYSKPARVHTHYHGWSSTVAERLGHGAGLGARIREIQALDPQTVFVLPEAKNAPATPGSSYATDWSNVSSQASTTADALAAAGAGEGGATVVSAHSGGGVAISRAMGSAADGSGLRADRIELLDCLYGAYPLSWANTANGKAVKEVVYVRGTNGAGRDAAFAAAFGDRYERIEVSSFGPITKDNNPILRDASGRVLGRKYAPDPHNRAVGELLEHGIVR